ncbi:MAG TPA: thiamine pyrophosphate-binding protein, partial [Nitrososphaerales archaeon]|nr:thiamine pyrophosphate-binding protein [Nitrososphaerales archaeon]
MNVAELFVFRLRQFGVERIYGLIGTSIIDLIDSIGESRIRYISTRHDQAAVSMAVAEGKLRGFPGVALVHGGPGFLNSITPMAVAYKDSVPAIVISGAVKRRLRGLDSWLEVDQQEIVRSIVKSSFSIQKPSEANVALTAAFESASSPPCGPSFIEVPEDVWHLESGPIKDTGIRNHSRQLPKQTEVERAIELLKKSKSPVILAGGGINDEEGSALLLKFAERFRIPVATTGNGRGAIPEDNPLSIGRAGYGGGNTVSDRLIQRSDYLISLGAGLFDVTTYSYNYLPKGEIVTVTLDSLASNKPVPYSLVSISDAKLFLRLMLETKDSYAPDPTWKEEMRNQANEWDSLLRDISTRTKSGFVNPSRFFEELDRRVPKDLIVSAGQGLHVLYPYAYLKIRAHSSFLAATNLGAMGYAFPAALGAKATFPNRMVVAVLGDGEFLMSLPDLETAARENLSIKIIVVNDNSYRVLYMRQKIQKMGRV